MIISGVVRHPYDARRACDVTARGLDPTAACAAGAAMMVAMRSPMVRRLGGRRGLQACLGALSLIPLASGLAGMLAGPSALPGTKIGDVSPTLDSEYRFVNAYWVAIAPILWASIPRVERRGDLLRPLGVITFAGGLARLRSLRNVGRPHPVMVGALVIELAGIPALLAWHTAIARAAHDDAG